jgi:hypothetical protein
VKLNTQRMGGAVPSWRGPQLGGAQGLWSENLKERDHSEDVGVDGRIILE